MAALVLLLGLTGATAKAATLSGRVQAADGSGLAARIVVLHGGRGASLATYDTETDGTFSIKVETAGLRAAAAAATGYASEEHSR